MDDSQRKRIETELRGSESKDRINSLPDEVLGRILSFLPTKYAVATSVLSSRWKDLYKLTTTLEFDESTHLIKCEANFKTRGRRWKGVDTFRGFVNKILPEYKSNFSKFRLICEKPLYNLVEVMSAYEIAEFELSILADQISYTLKLHKLKCENLVVLKLNGPMDVEVRKSVTFPVLKVLFLIEVQIHAYAEPSSVNQGLNEILKGCPLLQELMIEGCDWNAGEFRDLEFTNPLLRSLTFASGVIAPLDQLNGYTVHMDLPNLVHLDYLECLAEEYIISNLNSIREAKIDAHFNSDLFEEEELSNTILDLIEGVCCCQTLQLASQCVEGLTSWKFELPTFCNLTRLHLSIGSNVSWDEVLWDFLDSSPCLESLTLEQEDEKDRQRWQWTLPNEVVPCVKSHLKFINIIGFNGIKEEIKMIFYFLKNANVLEKMVVHWDNSERTETEMEVLQLPKSSKSCVIAFN